jgi:hypothetical protein
VRDERDAIIMRICNTLPRSYVNVEETLAEAGFFDLLEAAEDGSGCCECPASVRLRAAIRRCKDGGK